MATLISVGDDLAAILELGGPYDEFELEAGTHEVRRSIVLSYPLTVRGLGGGAVLRGAPDGPLLVVQRFAVPPVAGGDDDDPDEHEIGIEIEIADVAFVHLRTEAGPEGHDVVRVEDGKVRFAGCRFAGGRLGGRREHGAGLRARASAAVTLKACVAEDNEQAGLLVEDEARSEVDGCVFRRNGVGATFSGRAAGLVRDCTAEGNARFGFMVTDQAKPTLVENRIHRNGAPGVAVVDEARPLVVDNKLDAADMADEDPTMPAGPPDEDLKNPETVLSLIGIPPLTLEVGEGLIPLVDPGQGGELMDLVVPMRVEIGLALGFVMPGVQFKDNLTLPKDHFRIQVKGVPTMLVKIPAGHRLAVALPGTDLTQPLGGPDLEGGPPGLRARWIADVDVPRAEALGWKVRGPQHWPVACLEAVVADQAWAILSREEVRIMVDKLREKAPAVLRELIPDRLDLGTLHQVLQRLLRERVPIRDLPTICEALHDASIATGDPGQLAEFVRKRLARRIGEDLADPERRIWGVTLDPETERHVHDELTLLADDAALPAREAMRRRAALESLLLDQLARVRAVPVPVPVLLVSPALRPALGAFLGRYTARLRVLASDELYPGYPFVDLSLVDPG